MNNDMDAHIFWFNSYAAQKTAFAENPFPMQLKHAHSMRVYANALRITEEENFDPLAKRRSLLAALYHDVARFDQYLLHGTFKDAQSFNHGLQAVRILKAEKRLADESRKTTGLVLAAVGLHNRRQLPGALPEDLRLLADCVRDADKLDILRVMRAQLAIRPYNPTVVLGLPDDPESSCKRVLQSALGNSCGTYGDLCSVNDFRVLLGSWFFAMNFPSSRRAFIREAQAEEIVAALPNNQIYSEVREHLLKTFANAKKDLLR